MIDKFIKFNFFTLLMLAYGSHCLKIYFQNPGIKKQTKLRYEFIRYAFSTAPPSQGYNGWNIDNSETEASKSKSISANNNKASDARDDYFEGRKPAVSRPPIRKNFAAKSSPNRFQSNGVYGRNDRATSFDSTLSSKRNEGSGFPDGRPNGRFNSYSNRESASLDRRSGSTKPKPGYKEENESSRNSPQYKPAYNSRGNVDKQYQQREVPRQPERKTYNQFQSKSMETPINENYEFDEEKYYRDVDLKNMESPIENYEEHLEEFCRREEESYASTHSSNNDYEGGRREPAYGYFNGDHIYGVLPVRLALSGGRRVITELLIQEGMDIENKKDQTSVVEILELAKTNQIPIREFSKHDLNMLTDSRPHQGFVLRAAPLQFQKITSLPPSENFKCVLALDEVWDPQNLGALLRTCHFLGCDGVVVCAKNSAPLSSSVSKASAGAMELMDISSTSNMMKFLDESRKNGWQIVGTALDPTAINLNALPLDKPTVLVLGNEGHGIRTNILRRCDVLVKIGALGEGSGGGSVDSLNVSVTGGIMLHHILTSKRS